MNREEYIERLLAIYRLRYKANDVEIEEFKLLLEMMPDKEKVSLTMPSTSPETLPVKPSPWPDPNRPVILAYGCPYPDVTYNGFSESNQTTSDANGHKKER